ncbi:MAG TPA: DsbA family protein [Candidatus Nanoarchaeia archaeon]|nr:DsbA family protein [Candidatus Nanoarchaeia archaeon]
MSDNDTITINIGKYKNMFKNFRVNLWLVTTIVLAIILAVVLFTGSENKDNLSENLTITAEEAGQKMVDFANSQGASSSLIEANDAGALYEVVLSIDGQKVPIYVTKDGESFTTTLIPFDLDNPTDTTNNQNSNIEISLDSSDPVLGDPNAPISIIEYSDFECPFCERAYSNTIASLKESDAFKNGEINLIYRHFPLNNIHPKAQKAAEASVCAQKQSKFWEYHDTLFENQNALAVDDLKSYASDLGLNQAKFDSCLDNGEAKDKVDKDLISATASGGTGTPYFIILNKETEKTTSISGAVPYSQIESAIEFVKS